MFKTVLCTLMATASLAQIEAPPTPMADMSNCGPLLTCATCQADDNCGWYDNAISGQVSKCNKKANPVWTVTGASYTLAATCPDCDHNNCNLCLGEIGCKYYVNKLTSSVFKCQKGKLNDAEKLALSEKKKCEACEHDTCSTCQAEKGCKYYEGKLIMPNFCGKTEPVVSASYDVVKEGECSGAGSLQISAGLLAALLVTAF